MELKIATPTKYADSKIFKAESGFNYFQRGDDFYLDGEATEGQLLAAFAAHNPTAPEQATVADKLQTVGLSVSDLKAALGL